MKSSLKTNAWLRGRGYIVEPVKCPAGSGRVGSGKLVGARNFPRRIESRFGFKEAFNSHAGRIEAGRVTLMTGSNLSTREKRSDPRLRPCKRRITPHIYIYIPRYFPIHCRSPRVGVGWWLPSNTALLALVLDFGFRVPPL